MRWHQLAALRLVAAVTALVTVSGCKTTAGVVPVLSGEQAAQGIARLSRPLPGDMSALYHLRVPSSGGLRLSIITRDGGGRMTIAEPFGSALSITVWSDSQSAELYDLKEGCRLDIRRVASSLGIGDLPMPQVSRLLGGGLPALPPDRVDAGPDGLVNISGHDWTVTAALEPDPWRVVEISSHDEAAWRLELDDHTVSVPGWVRIEHQDGRWAELELKRLQWNVVSELPAPPELPLCEPR